MASLEKIDNKNFVIKCPSKDIHYYRFMNKTLNHLGSLWTLNSGSFDDPERAFSLRCVLLQDSDLWNIDASVTFDVKKGIHGSWRMHGDSETINTCFNRSNPEIKYVFPHGMKMDKFRKAYPNFEVHVKINSITGLRRQLRKIDFEKEDGQLSDVVLVVEGKKLYVNKAVLATHSPVFRAMFFSGFKESTDKEVIIKDVKFEYFEPFLQVIHSADHYIDEENIEKILILADRYDVGIVMTKCENYLLSTYDVADAEKLRLAETYTFPDVHEKCMKLIDTKQKLAKLCENTSKFGPMTLQAIIQKTKDLQN